MIFLISFFIFFGLGHTKETNRLNLWVTASEMAEENISNAENYVINFVNDNFGAEYVKIIDYNNKIPVCEHNNRTIILRLDDVKAWQYYDITTDMTSLILSKNMTLTIGVIPKDIEKDKILFLPWLNKIKDNPNIEIALHGYLHERSEFKNLNEEEATYRIKKGKELLLKYADVVPVTFIPPENEFSDETLDALSNEGFKVLSAGNPKDIKISQYNPIRDNLIYIGKTSETYNYHLNKFIPAEQVLKECKIRLDEDGLCVIMLHPQDFLSLDRTQIDEEKYNEFIKLLDGLEDFNADFKNFKDVANCRV